jgi:cell division transport system permease protein
VIDIAASEAASAPPPPPEDTPLVAQQGPLRGWRPFGGVGGGVLFPQARLSGPTPWVIAIMVALTVVAAATGLALRHIANAAAVDVAGGVTVQIVEALPAQRQVQAQAALSALQPLAGVESVRLVPQAEVDQLLNPWLGMASGDGEMLPVPALIDVRLKSSANERNLADLREVLSSVAPAARVDAQSNWLTPVFDAIDSLRWLALAMVGLLAVALSAAVVLAARSALGAHHETIEIVHNLGGTDAQIARIFQRAIGLDAMLGGAVGLAVGGMAVMLLGQRFGALGAGLVAGGALEAGDWLVIALVPLAAIALAMFTARQTVLMNLRKML